MFSSYIRYLMGLSLKLTGKIIKQLVLQCTAFVLIKITCLKILFVLILTPSLVGGDVKRRINFGQPKSYH